MSRIKLAEISGPESDYLPVEISMVAKSGHRHSVSTASLRERGVRQPAPDQIVTAKRLQLAQWDAMVRSWLDRSGA